MVVMSLVATILGASTTVGLIEKASDIGFAAFWWIGVGVIGLAAQAIFLTRKVRSIDAVTLPDLAGKTAGGFAKKLTALIIVIAWTGIIAAQFVTAGRIIGILLGIQDITWVLLVVAGAMIIYSILGGQLSVLKTDLMQGGIMIIALILAFVFLYFIPGGNPGASYDFRLFNEKFGAGELLTFLLIVGGPYMVGPDMFSRIFTAKDAGTARRSVWIASGVLLLAGVLIAVIGVWGRANITPVPGTDTIGALLNSLPEFVRILLLFGFLSAVLSSADTCLLSAGTILERDIIGKERVGWIRGWIAAIGAAATVITLLKKDIIGLLLYAYSIYTPGVVIPLGASIIVYGKRKPHPVWLSLGIGLGGAMGLSAKILEITTKSKYDWIVFAGIGVSAVFTAISLIQGKKLTPVAGK
jgi:SSS family solute:Na+ symporter